MQISPLLLRGLWAYVRDHSDKAQAFLAQAGLTREQLGQPRGFAALPDVHRALRVAYGLLEDPALALHLGNSVPPQMLNVIGQLFVHCSTMRAAFVELERYLPLIVSAGSFRLQERAGQGSLIFDVPFSGSETHEQRFATEFAFALIVRVARQFVGERSAPVELRLSYARPGHAAEYEAIFRCPLRFAAERCEIVFDASLLDHKQPFSDERLYRVLKEQAEHLLISELPVEPLHVRVKTVLKDAPALGGVSRNQVARRLGLSARSLHRRLAQEGQTLSMLLEEVRQELAFQLLRSTEIPLKQIAERLGFSEPSAFHRAFKRWTGTTPISYRAEGAALSTQVA